MEQFDGATYVAERDGERLGRQVRRIRELMLDGGWWTLSLLAEHAECSEASASARIRDLRKVRFGGYTIDRRYVRRGLYEYQLVKKEE